MSYRQTLINIYLDWRNNYCSVHTFAEHNGLDYEQASELLCIARKVFDSQHPDA